MRKIRDLGINVIPGTREPNDAIDGFDLAAKKGGKGGGKAGSKGGKKGGGKGRRCESSTCDPAPSANCGRKRAKTITAEAIGQLQAQLLQKLESHPILTI